MPRVGDIAIIAEQRKLAFGTLTRIFTPRDKDFRLDDLKNADNTLYPTHVCQVGYLPEHGFIFKDTKAKGLVINPLDTYHKMKDQKVLAVFRPREYNNSFVRKAFCDRLVQEVEEARKAPKKYRYDFGGLREDYVPNFLLTLLPWLGALRERGLLYCSERVQRDWHLDGGQGLEDPAFSPADCDTICRLKGLENVASEYEFLS